MRKLETKAFQACFIQWIQSVSEMTSGAVVAIDGKTLRRSHDRQSGVPAIHMVSAWSSENGLVLGQEKTAEKSNEITAIPKGCIVTIDAMGCQTAIAEKTIMAVIAINNSNTLPKDAPNSIKDNYLQLMYPVCDG
jgi:hypothetical protein